MNRPYLDRPIGSAMGVSRSGVLAATVAAAILANSGTAEAAALRRLADAEKPLYQSLDEAQKRRFGLAFRFAAHRHRAEAHG